MEHPCYRCHAEIPEGVAFCPHCAAPQIRVAAPEGSAEAQQPSSSDAIAQAAPPTAAAPPAYWTQPSQYPVQPNVIQWSAAWKGALLAGLAAAVLSAIPIVSMGCLLWMLGAGALSVALYRRQVPGTPITSAMGMKVGALAGVFGWIANACVTTTSFLLMRSDTFRHAMQEQMQRQIAGNQDPKVQEMMQNLLDWMGTPQGAATMIVLVVLVFGAIFLVLTAAGGALGASIFGQRREPR